MTQNNKIGAGVVLNKKNGAAKSQGPVDGAALVKSAEQLELEKLRAENAALKAAAEKRSTVTAKVSVKGAISVYGLQRMPVTLYAQQWERLLSAAVKTEIDALISRGRKGETFTVSGKDESGQDVTAQVQMAFK